jgi:hypothetical protein
MKVNDLINQIENLDYYPISDNLWNLILIRGYVDKFFLNKEDCFISELILEEQFRANMMRYKEVSLWIISSFDEQLYSQYRSEYFKIDDFDLGKIYIIRVKK